MKTGSTALASHSQLCSPQIARVLGAFVTVHRYCNDGSKGPENAERVVAAAAAAAFLVEQQLESAAMVDPFLAALGVHPVHPVHSALCMWLSAGKDCMSPVIHRRPQICVTCRHVYGASGLARRCICLCYLHRSGPADQMSPADTPAPVWAGMAPLLLGALRPTQASCDPQKGLGHTTSFLHCCCQL